MSTASFSSSLSIASRICCLYRSMYTRVEPPPGTIPSSIAAFTELRASSYRSFLSFSSVSVAAPTLIRPIAPPSFATRSSAFSRSNSESVAWPSAFTCAIRLFTSSSWSPVAIIVVRSLNTAARCARPSISIVTWRGAEATTGRLRKLRTDCEGIAR